MSLHQKLRRKVSRNQINKIESYQLAALELVEIQFYGTVAEHGDACVQR